MSLPVTAALGSISSHLFRGPLSLPFCVVLAAIFPGWVIGVTHLSSCSSGALGVSRVPCIDLLLFHLNGL